MSTWSYRHQHHLEGPLCSKIREMVLFFLVNFVNYTNSGYQISTESNLCILQKVTANTTCIYILLFLTKLGIYFEN